MYHAPLYSFDNMPRKPGYFGLHLPQAISIELSPCFRLRAASSLSELAAGAFQAVIE